MNIQESLRRVAHLVSNWWRRRSGRGADVVEHVKRRLHGKPHLALDNVSCSYYQGVLTLHGWVNTNCLKRTAEAVASRVAGVEWIENEIEILPPAPGRLAPFRPGKTRTV
jgi:hypothetical protein